MPDLHVDDGQMRGYQDEKNGGGSSLSPFFLVDKTDFTQTTGKVDCRQAQDLFPLYINCQSEVAEQQGLWLLDLPSMLEFAQEKTTHTERFIDSLCWIEFLTFRLPTVLSCASAKFLPG